MKQPLRADIQGVVGLGSDDAHLSAKAEPERCLATVLAGATCTLHARSPNGAEFSKKPAITLRFCETPCCRCELANPRMARHVGTISLDRIQPMSMPVYTGFTLGRVSHESCLDSVERSFDQPSSPLLQHLAWQIVPTLHTTSQCRMLISCERGMGSLCSRWPPSNAHKQSDTIKRGTAWWYSLSRTQL